MAVTARVDRERIRRTLTFWLRPAFVLRTVRRFQQVAGFDRAIALASSAFTALIPLAILLGAILPHLDAAYNLARWLVRTNEDADDVVQEACLRAFRYFAGFRGTAASEGRAWLLAIVRNTARTWRDRNRHNAQSATFDEELHSDAIADDHPEAAIVRQSEDEAVRAAIDRLPTEFREVIVLRELEGLSYKEIAAVADVPLGTVMSRLARARQMLGEMLMPQGVAAMRENQR